MTTRESPTKQIGKSYFETMNLTEEDVSYLIQEALDQTPLTMIINE